MGFMLSPEDKGLYVKRTRKGICYIAVWVDDCYCVGLKPDLEEVIKDIQNHFKI